MIFLPAFLACCGLFSKGLKNFTSRFGPLTDARACVSFPRVRVVPSGCSMRLSALAERKKAARLGCNPPALAARKKAACPVRSRTRPCRRQEGGLSCAATHPPLPQARRRLAWGAPPRPPGRLNGRRRHSWRGRGRWDRLRCSPPIPCWASRNPSPWGPGRGNIFQRSPGTAGIPW